MDLRAPRAQLAALIMLSAIWGYSWVFLKLGLRDADPFAFAGLRTLLAAAGLCGVMLVQRRPLRPAHPLAYAVLGLFNTSLALGCSQWALVHGAASRTSILMYTMPFMTLLLAWPLLGERIGRAQAAAIACGGLGLAGMVLPISVLDGATVAMLGGALAWAIAAIYMKWLVSRGPLDLLSMTTWQLAFGGSVLLAIAFGSGQMNVDWTPRFITVLCVTSLVSTAFGWVVWAHMLERMPAGHASMMTLLVPVIAVLSTALTLGERPAVRDLAGSALIVAGLAILAWRALREQRAVTGVAAPE